MKYMISREILNRATKCTENYSCLKGKGECLCEVEDCADGKIHFVDPDSHSFNCNYRMPFGDAFTCNCPVRKEIYNLYKM